MKILFAVTLMSALFSFSASAQTPSDDKYISDNIVVLRSAQLTNAQFEEQTRSLIAAYQEQVYDLKLKGIFIKWDVGFPVSICAEVSPSSPADALSTLGDRVAAKTHLGDPNGAAYYHYGTRTKGCDQFND